MTMKVQKTNKTPPLVIENEKRSEWSTLGMHFHQSLSAVMKHGNFFIWYVRTWHLSSIWLVPKFSDNQKVWFHPYNFRNNWLWYFSAPHWLGYFVLVRSLPSIHSFHQSLKQMHWFEAIFKMFGSAIFEAIEVKGR